MMRKHIWTIIIGIGLCMVCLCACGGSGSDTEDAGTQEVETQSAADDSAWKAAYLDVLQADQEAIDAYTRDDVSGKVALSDLNGDSIPELLYFVREQGQPFPYMKVWTYADGSSRQLSYQTALADDEYSDLPTDALYDYEVQGGTDYMVFKTDDGSLQMISFTFGAENSTGAIRSYQMDSNTELTQTQWVGFVDEFMNSFLEQPSDLRIIYRKDGEEISEDEYGEFCAACTEGMDEVIFCSRRPNEVEELKAFWDAAETREPAGQTYDEIAQQLM